MTPAPTIMAEALDRGTREALAGLLLSMADDEFVLGFWDSEWTGIAPLLEEDVAQSSIAQDEIGHAQALYQLLAELTGGNPDRIAFGRQPGAYRHARLLDHARTDWAFSIARRFLYDTADAARLDLLVAGAWPPLAGVVAKMRREETYHLLHMHAWLERLATGGDDAHGRLVAALERLWPDALTVLAPLPGEELLVEAGILGEPLAAAEQRWLDGLHPIFVRLELPWPFRQSGEGSGEPQEGSPVDQGRGAWEPTLAVPAEPRGGHDGSESFRWLWGEFTMVYRSDPEATW